jgi:uncharacterized membrane protein
MKKIILSIISICLSLLGLFLLLMAFVMTFGTAIDMSPPGSELGGIVLGVLSIIFFCIAYFSWKKRG